jgi:hypothetical protein
VPPPIRLFLVQLGLWDRFRQAGHAASYRTVAAWGGPELASNEFLLSAHQCGWRLDRAGFDRMLAEAAEEGGTRRLRANVRRLAHEAGSWRIDCGADAEILTARFVLDATGRAAALSRMLGSRPAGRDGLIGCYVHFEGGREADQGTMIEAFSDGCVFGRLPGTAGDACMTDADVLRRRGLRGLEAGWPVKRGSSRRRPAMRHPATPSLRPAIPFLAETRISLLAVATRGSPDLPGALKALVGIFAAMPFGLLCRGDDQGRPVSRPYPREPPPTKGLRHTLRRRAAMVRPAVLRGGRNPILDFRSSLKYICIT